MCNDDDTEKEKEEEINFILSGVQMTVLDLLYKMFVQEISKKKSEFNYTNYDAC